MLANSDEVFQRLVPVGVNVVECKKNERALMEQEGRTAEDSGQRDNDCGNRR